MPKARLEPGGEWGNGDSTCCGVKLATEGMCGIGYVELSMRYSALANGLNERPLALFHNSAIATPRSFASCFAWASETAPHVAIPRGQAVELVRLPPLNALTLVL